jgi:hypothetical protein
MTAGAGIVSGLTGWTKVENHHETVMVNMHRPIRMGCASSMRTTSVTQLDAS